METLATLDKSQIKAFCQAHKLDSNGTKRQLLSRIEDANFVNDEIEAFLEDVEEDRRKEQLEKDKERNRARLLEMELEIESLRALARTENDSEIPRSSTGASEFSKVQISKNLFPYQTNTNHVVGYFLSNRTAAIFSKVDEAVPREMSRALSEKLVNETLSSERNEFRDKLEVSSLVDVVPISGQSFPSAEEHIVDESPVAEKHKTIFQVPSLLPPPSNSLHDALPLPSNQESAFNDPKLTKEQIVLNDNNQVQTDEVICPFVDLDEKTVEQCIERSVPDTDFEPSDREQLESLHDKLKPFLQLVSFTHETNHSPLQFFKEIVASNIPFFEMEFRFTDVLF